ncbi:hypothetical protein KIN20_019764 [Parelaphostrongylus tenuis]|uniref:Uncharacterized protein n=1 Tax=Parelaphostrongylus tenuis TaxID=148309 RepID=A0AAD5MS11_PARTN|nr:hypothetical protein KIN20_019764 [Parelaphostrongylus tenuis]
MCGNTAHNTVNITNRICCNYAIVLFTVQDNLERLQFQGEWDDRFRKEKREYEAALSKQDAIEKELELSRTKFETAQRIMDIYKEQTDNLLALYDKQDKLLIGIFGDDYASEKENVLEGEVDEMMDWQQRVALAMFKWTNGRVLLVHALTQITFGINRWQDIKKIDVREVDSSLKTWNISMIDSVRDEDHRE